MNLSVDGGAAGAHPKLISGPTSEKNRACAQLEHDGTIKKEVT